MVDPKYAFISAYLKGEEARIITTEHVGRILKAASLQDVLAVIADTDIGDYFEGTLVKNFDELDEYLWRYLGRCTGQIQSFKFVPSAVLEILKAYLAKYDVLNIKATWQRISGGRKANLIPVGTIHDNGLLAELAGAEDLTAVIGLLNKAKLLGYAAIVGQYSTDEGAKARLAEARLDEEYYTELSRVVKGVKGGPALARALAVVIDLLNLQIVLRAVARGMVAEVAEYTVSGGYIITGELIKELLALKLGDIPARLADTPYHDVAEEVVSGYSRTKSLASIDEAIGSYRFVMLKETLSTRMMSPLLIAWYLTLKEAEIRNLRLILKATLDRVPLDGVRNYLVLGS
ncbi:MAG: V-type ATPase subunit [Chloroflexota bacterium]